jgi:putative chitinase
MKLYEKYNTTLNKYGINTKLRTCHFFAQIEHESRLKPISENLNYSADGLINTFHKYFTKETALSCARKPEIIANIVYANRMGNGGVISGDGWKYRGRGFLQITGKENYSNLAKDVGIDCLNNPDLLLEEANAMISALWFWNKKGLNIYADEDNISTITKRINGGFNGIEHRKELLVKYKKELK